ncbi:MULTISPECIES: SH3 domain-containing protein [Weeksellaceae]|jgi:hypothetical protein|uniref:SH3 domain-containing protein n=1 Tax=Faecalibacter macacae TaxID=1859289 RepID=A0A3L9M5S4_9FLAO|nr:MULTISPECIES: SH3 domain-containing protein [Weeksellaceae]MDM1524287.1 SH3 domain-containing protein [Empedobacter sp. 225-1]MDM1544205.1 SH3 domain-containing protein [Empedobacter sp. 189-2]RLZ06664.1 SH3 domain-containing protein [Faecalibacter macacae]
MNKFLLIFFLITPIYIFSQVNVKGYYRKDGTYVRPHVRTYPNNTVTDNYSYPGNYNPNLEYNKPNYNSNYNNSRLNSSSNNSNYNNYNNSETKKNSNYSNSDNSRYSSKKYVNTQKVNIRSTPNTGNNIIGELSYGEEIKFLNKVGYWDKVIVKTYNSYSNSYENNIGYINSRFLSNSNNSNEIIYNNYEKNVQKKYMVIASKTHFCNSPNINSKKTSYLVYGDMINSIAESKYFVYTEFYNSSGKKTIGWILKDHLTIY